MKFREKMKAEQQKGIYQPLPPLSPSQLQHYEEHLHQVYTPYYRLLNLAYYRYMFLVLTRSGLSGVDVAQIVLETERDNYEQMDPPNKIAFDRYSIMPKSLASALLLNMRYTPAMGNAQELQKDEQYYVHFLKCIQHYRQCKQYPPLEFIPPPPSTPTHFQALMEESKSTLQNKEEFEIYSLQVPLIGGQFLNVSDYASLKYYSIQWLAFRSGMKKDENIQQATKQAVMDAFAVGAPPQFVPFYQEDPYHQQRWRSRIQEGSV